MTGRFVTGRVVPVGLVLEGCGADPHADVSLTLVGEAAFDEAAKLSGPLGVVLSTPSRRKLGTLWLDPRVRHVFTPGPGLGALLTQTVAMAEGRAPRTPASLELGTRFLHVMLTSTAEAERLRAQAEGKAQQVGARGQALHQWLDALGEAVSNAIYDAPRVGAAAPYQGLHRKHAVTLDPKHAVEIELFENERAMAFVVRDRFGGLTANHLRTFIGTALASESAQPSQKAGGAGLGLVMMVDRLERLVVLSTPSQETAVVGVAPKRYGRDRALSPTVQFFG